MMFKHLTAISFLIFIFVSDVMCKVEKHENENEYPIVGILAQEVSSLISTKYPNEKFNSYIAASYVKFVEGSGARVVPIWIGKDRSYYQDILSKINGVLLPGGSTFFNQSMGYADAGKHIYDIAMELNIHGTYFPIWGTCLGFELLVYLSANGKVPRTYCPSSSQALPLQLKADFNKSRMFRNAKKFINTLRKYPVTANFHMYCFTEETFEQMKLDQMWTVMSLYRARKNETFISTIEHKRYPFYGVQFHPEKDVYEYIPDRNITQILRAIRASRYFADFFVGETRRNHQYITNKTEEKISLIYNYAPKYTGLEGSAFEQQYFFSSSKRQHNFLSIAMNWISLMVIYKVLV